MARDRERWKALCKPSTATGRKGSANGSEVKQLPFRRILKAVASNCGL